jgi:hypothetical protein
MTEQIRIIPHSREGLTGCFEVAWLGGKRFIYWDDLPGGRAITQHLSRDDHSPPPHPGGASPIGLGGNAN